MSLHSLGLYCLKKHSHAIEVLFASSPVDHCVGNGGSEGKQCLRVIGKTVLGPFPFGVCGLGQAEKPH